MLEPFRFNPYHSRLVRTGHGSTLVTLPPRFRLAILPFMPRTPQKPRKPRPPRIRVPNQQKAIFTVDDKKLLGVVQRLSLTGGSALLVKGPIPEGALGEIVFGTIFGKVEAQVQFLQMGADGVPLAQAFSFLTMGAVSSERFKRALQEMQSSDLSDHAQTQRPFDSTFETLRRGIRQISGMLNSARQTRPKRGPA